MVRPTVFVCVLFWFKIRCHAASPASLAEHTPEAELTFIAFLTSFERGVYGVVCSGTIIHERFVLTAANCFYTCTGEPISYQHKVLIASDYKAIRRLIPHPRYFLRTWDHDVGLIELTEKVVFGPRVSKMRLAKKADLRVNDVAYTTCWVMKDKKSSFREESVKIAPRRHCGRPPYYGRYITKDMTCAEANNTCTVDSGAPLLKGGRQHSVASRQYWRQLVFTDIYRVRGWIGNTLFGEHIDEYLSNYVL